MTRLVHKKLARNESSPRRTLATNEHGKMFRRKFVANWGVVYDMLTDPKAPRRDAKGRDVFEVWADQTLENPAEMFAFVCREILPQEPNEAQAPVVQSIQNLYLQAVMGANREPATVIEAPKALPEKAESGEW